MLEGELPLRIRFLPPHELGAGRSGLVFGIVREDSFPIVLDWGTFFPPILGLLFLLGWHEPGRTVTVEVYDP